MFLLLLSTPTSKIYILICLFILNYRRGRVMGASSKAVFGLLIATALLIAGCSPGRNAPQQEPLNRQLNSEEGIKMGTLKISSPVFDNNGMIPKKYTCDGEDINPPLLIDGVPEGTKSLALIVDDPDAPMGTWVHWVVWNINADTREIGEGEKTGGVEGMNDFRKHSYGGPCPPSGTHRYFFKVYALDSELNIPDNSDKDAVEEAMSGHILDKAELVGLYRRS